MNVQLFVHVYSPRRGGAGRGARAAGRVPRVRCCRTWRVGRGLDPRLGSFSEPAMGRDLRASECKMHHYLECQNTFYPISAPRRRCRPPSAVRVGDDLGRAVRAACPGRAGSAVPRVHGPSMDAPSHARLRSVEHLRSAPRPAEYRSHAVVGHICRASPRHGHATARAWPRSSAERHTRAVGQATRLGWCKSHGARLNEQ